MTNNPRWQIPLIVVLAVYAGAVLALALRLPVKDGVTDWFGSLFPGGWMAWSFPGALFFLTIFLLLALMAVWEYARPGGHRASASSVSRRHAGIDFSFRCSAAPSSISLGWV